MSSHQHPWLLTVEQHIERIRSEFGAGPAAAFEALALIRGYDPDEVLELDTLRSLYLGADLPTHDFGLDPYSLDPS